MPNRVFDRSLPGGHPFDPALEQWLSRHPPDDYRALAHNLVHDHRVTLEREAVLLRYFAAAGGTPEKRVEDALKSYMDEEIRFRKRPAFLDRRTNGPNLIRGAGTHLLARVLDLNGLTTVYLLGKHRRMAAFRDFPIKAPRRPTSPARYTDQVLAWLDDRLTTPVDRQKEFVGAVLDALELSRQSRPYQPGWATYWPHFSALAGDKPERWAGVVGMPNPRRCPRWLIVLRYRFRGKLVRPTILDTGLNPYHFPSPPQAPMGSGGHPVDLQLTPPPAKLLPEFIHQQIPHPFSHWEDSGFLLGRTDPPRRGWLVHRRRNHHALLRSVYGDDVKTWMEQCI